MAKRRLIGLSAWIVGGAGLLIGVIAAVLVELGNPGNMGLCIACFTRDTMSVFGGETANMSAFAYIRPELLGILFGAAASAALFREWRPRGGSAFWIRFVLGFIFIIAALIFLGCTVRAWLRLGGGDLNALVGIAGLIFGIGIGVWFLKRGFNLGRSKHYKGPKKWTGIIATIVALALLGLGVALSMDISIPGIAWAEKGIGPGGSRAPLAISLAAGLAVGVIAQRSRFCTIGGIRDVMLVRRFDLLFGVVGVLIGVAVTALLLGSFNLGFEGQPAAHTDQAANFFSLLVAGLAATLLGGCPLRQVIMSGEGDTDAVAALLGMMAGAFAAHYFGIAATPAGITTNAWIALAMMGAIVLAIGSWKSRSRAA